MSKVAFTTLLKREDSALSPHFGTAKWIMIYDCDTAQIAFEQNTALNGRGVADVIARHESGVLSSLVSEPAGYGNSVEHVFAAGSAPPAHQCPS